MSSTTTNQPIELNPADFDESLLKTAQDIGKICADFAKTISINPRQMELIKQLFVGFEKLKALDQKTQDRFFDYYGSESLDVVAPIFRDYATRTPAEITALICQLPEKKNFIKRNAVYFELTFAFIGFAMQAYSSRNDIANVLSSVLDQSPTQQVVQQVESPSRTEGNTLSADHEILVKLDLIQDQLTNIAQSLEKEESK